MSTPGSKPLLALRALATLGVIFGALLWALTSLSVWAERDLDAHPFASEDWLRYLLSSRIEAPGAPRILLAGPSTVRENLRFEMIEDAFPAAAVYQGGIGSGTLEDTITSLEYLRAVHGDDAMPDIVVLGLSPRYVANIPEDRPFRLGIDKYSPYFRIEEVDGDYTLVPKSLAESLRARFDFLALKQPDRFITALLATADHMLGKVPGALEAANGAVRSLSEARHSGATNVLYAPSLADRVGPYKYAWLRPYRQEDLAGPETPTSDTVWGRIVRWKPADDIVTQTRMDQFAAIIDDLGIKLIVINMPELAKLRDLFGPEYDDYLRLTRSHLGADLYLDLRAFLDDDGFFDAEHTVPAGSRLLTEEVIRHLAPLVEGGA